MKFGYAGNGRASGPVSGRSTGRAMLRMFAACLVLGWAGNAFGQAGITVQAGTDPTGTIGHNKGSVGAVQCPAGTVLNGVRHVDKSMTASSGITRGMTAQLGLYCARVSTDGATVTVTQTTANGSPEVPGYAYGELGVVQNAYCPAGQVAHQFGGWDRRVVAGNPYNVPWASAVRLVCRPLQLNANHWVRVNTEAAGSQQDAGEREGNAPHNLRGPFCSGSDSLSMVSGYHRQAGGLGYDGINVYCGAIRQARFSAAMTFTDFGWSTTLGESGWLVDLRRSGETLNDGDNNNGAGRTPHAGTAANTNTFQSGREIYVIPNTGYGAVVSARPAGIAANTHVVSGTCLGTGIELSNEQDASCTLDVHGLPDIGVSVAVSPLEYDHHGQSRNLTVVATNHGPGAVEATDGFTLVTTLPPGWTATAVPGCSVVGQVVTCSISSTLAAGSAPGVAGGNVSFTIPVTVNAPTVSGTYPATVALGRSGPDGDADPYNNDYNTSNDTATAQLVLALSADVSVTKTNQATTLMGGQETVYTIVVSNAGPASADGTVVQDPPPVGATCTLVTCGNATGGAICPASLEIDDLQAGGLVIPTLPASSSLTLEVSCTVD